MINSANVCQKITKRLISVFWVIMFCPGYLVAKAQPEKELLQPLKNDRVVSELASFFYPDYSSSIACFCHFSLKL